MLHSRISSSLQSAALPLMEREDITEDMLIAENKRLNAEVIRLKSLLQEAQHAADTDPLLQIYNRRAFIRELERAQTVSTRYDISSSLIFFDLNGFKAINDKYGHAAGDKVLETVGTILQSGVRQCDMVARLGGDEFGVLLFKSTPEIAKAKAAALACRIAQEIIKTPKGVIRISAAWGTALCDPQKNSETVLAEADQEMYVSKRQYEPSHRVA